MMLKQLMRFIRDTVNVQAPPSDPHEGWVTSKADGERLIPYDEMTDAHLLNAMIFCRRRFRDFRELCEEIGYDVSELQIEDMNPRYEFLLQEARRRGLPLVRHLLEADR